MNMYSILLVEDDKILSLANEEFLRDLGFIVETASNVDSALEIIYRCSALAALVTDIDLGGGLNGFDIARHARAVYPRLTVIYTSGTMAGSHAREGVAGSEFIAKPFHPRQIAQALNRAIGDGAADAA